MNSEPDLPNCPFEKTYIENSGRVEFHTDKKHLKKLVGRHCWIALLLVFFFVVTTSFFIATKQYHREVSGLATVALFVGLVQLGLVGSTYSQMVRGGVLYWWDNSRIGNPYGWIWSWEEIASIEVGKRHFHLLNRKGERFPLNVYLSHDQKVDMLALLREYLPELTINS